MTDVRHQFRALTSDLCLLIRMPRIYLDYASATPLLPEVRRAVGAVLEELGNPSSIHREGQRAKQAIEGDF